MKQFSKYLEIKFNKDLDVLFILDLNESLIELEEMVDYSLEITIFGKKFKIKSFTTKNFDDYYTFFEREIRNFKNKTRFLIILSHNLEDLPYLEFFKGRGAYLEFDIDDFIRSQFKISFNRKDLIHYKINWFIIRSLEILAYRTKYQVPHSTEIIHIQNNDLSQFFEFCEEYRQKNLLGAKPKRPLFVVDMTLFEFIQVLKFVHEVNQKFRDEVPSKDLLRKKRKIIKENIYDMFGNVPMDFDKRCRNLPNLNTKSKMAGNFMITINQLKLLEDIKIAEDLHTLYISNEKSFYKKLKNILLEDGKWRDYIEAIKNANEKDGLTTSGNYKQYISKYLQRKYYKFYPVRTERWRRQLNYVLKWLIDERLNICKKSQVGFKILIISEVEKDKGPIEITGKPKKSKIYKHVFNSEKKIWTRKLN
jgi:hypothetical protein